MDVHAIIALLSNPLTDEIRDHVVNSFIDFLLERGYSKGARIVGRFFNRRFRYSDEEELRIAVDRLTSFFDVLNERIEQLEGRGLVDRGRLDHLYEQPEIVAALHEAFDDAAETGDRLRQRSIADLVAGRLAAADESLAAVAYRAAIEAMRDLSPANLHALALIMFLGIELTAPREEYLQRLEPLAAPLVDAPASESTILHLASLGLLSYDSTGIQWENIGSPNILRPLGQLGALMQNETVARLYARGQGNPNIGVRPLQRLKLNPTGMLIGASALKELTGLDVPVEISD